MQTLNDRTDAWTGILFNHRQFAPWYDDSADYNTDAKSYYDYLARTNKLVDAMIEIINELVKRELSFTDTSSIDFTTNGDWTSVEEIVASAKVNISAAAKNSITVNQDGLYSKDFTDDIDNLKGITRTDTAINFLSDLIVNKQQPTNQQIVGSAASLIQAKLIKNTLMQDFWMDPLSGDYYATQGDGNVKPDDGFIINRLDAGGNIISHMYLAKAGHGIIVGYNWDSSVYFITEKDNQFYRYRYVDNSSTDITQGEKLTFPYTGYWDWTRDNGDGYIADYLYTTGSMRVYETNFSQNNFTFNGHEHIFTFDSSDMGTVQGVALFKYGEITGVDKPGLLVTITTFGTGSSETYGVVHLIDMNEGTHERIATLNGLQNVMKSNKDFNNRWLGYWETEGGRNLRLYSNDEMGTLSNYAFGFSVGSQGARQHFIYSIGNMYNQIRMNLQSDQVHNLTQARPLQDMGVTNLYQIMNPGTYSMTYAQVTQLQDMPWIATGNLLESHASWQLTVTMPNFQNDYMQYITIKSANASMTFYRYIEHDDAGPYGADYKPKVISKWMTVETTGNLNEIPAGITTLNDLNVSGVEYYIKSERFAQVAPDLVTKYGTTAAILKNSSISNNVNGTRYINQELKLINNTTTGQINRVIVINDYAYGGGGQYSSTLTPWR